MGVPSAHQWHLFGRSAELDAPARGPAALVTPSCATVERGKGGWGVPPPPPWTPAPDQSDHRGKKRNLPLGKSGRAIFGAPTSGSQTRPPPPPPSNTSLGLSRRGTSELPRRADHLGCVCRGQRIVHDRIPPLPKPVKEVPPSSFGLARAVLGGIWWSLDDYWSKRHKDGGHQGREGVASTFEGGGGRRNRDGFASGLHSQPSPLRSTICVPRGACSARGPRLRPFSPSSQLPHRQWICNRQ